MSEYEKYVGFGELKSSGSPRVDEIEALLVHIETQVKRTIRKPGIVEDLLKQIGHKRGEVSSGNYNSDFMKDSDIRIFRSAKAFLYKESPEEISDEMITRYLSPPVSKDDNNRIEDVFKKCLYAAMNSNINAKVVGASLGGSLEPLSNILAGFAPRGVVADYGDDFALLMEKVVTLIESEDEINTSPKSSWPKFCRTILSAAAFFAQFLDGDEFINWTDGFGTDYRSIPALPLLLGKEIYGMGFTIACDFLIELGLENYCTVDTTVKSMLTSSGLLHPGLDGYQTLKCISRIAQHNDTTPYQVDKVFWLIGTGYFYNHLDLGKQNSGARLKKLFLDLIGMEKQSETQTEA
ncbi:MAG: hypothetical protein JEY99_03010 [Spirochaetales bacterium]|nr:hypothetical protein [Spirochaetales bacterium]